MHIWIFGCIEQNSVSKTDKIFVPWARQASIWHVIASNFTLAKTTQGLVEAKAKERLLFFVETSNSGLIRCFFCQTTKFRCVYSCLPKIIIYYFQLFLLLSIEKRLRRKYENYVSRKQGLAIDFLNLHFLGALKSSEARHFSCLLIFKQEDRVI